MTLIKKGEDKEKHQPEAVGIYPKSAISWYNKGVDLKASGRMEEALECYNKAIDNDPNDKDAWINKGRTLNNLGRYEEAIIAFDKAIEINSKDEAV